MDSGDEDYDHDGCRDAEDPDLDGDGVPNNEEDPSCVRSIPATYPGAVADDDDGDGCLGGGVWLQDDENDWYCNTTLCDDGDNNTWC